MQGLLEHDGAVRDMSWSSDAGRADLLCFGLNHFFLAQARRFFVSGVWRNPMDYVLLSLVARPHAWRYISFEQAIEKDFNPMPLIGIPEGSHMPSTK